MEPVCCNCDEPLEDSWTECPVCDTPVSRQLFCSSCRKEMKPRWNKCPFCKTSLTGASSTPPISPAPASSFNPNLSVCDPSVPSASGSVNHASPGKAQPFSYPPQPTAASAAPLQLNPGEKLVGDRFTIIRQLGHGGFGSVYLASDSLTGLNLALKVVCPQVGTAQLALKQLLFEHEIRRKIHNVKHILPAELPFSCDFKGINLILMPMDHASGGSLRQWIIDHPDVNERKDKALAILRQTCAGVSAIHEAGIVHLDLKPENILLEGETVKIADFGLSRGLSHHSIASSELMRDGIGTPAYMAPEQILAARPQDVDHLADIYSLGVVLFEMLDGDPPYVGTAQQILDKMNQGIKPKLRTAHVQLAKVIWKCLEKKPEDRFQNIKELLNALEGKDFSGDIKEIEDYINDENFSHVRELLSLAKEDGLEQSEVERLELSLAAKEQEVRERHKRGEEETVRRMKESEVLMQSSFDMLNKMWASNEQKRKEKAEKERLAKEKAEAERKKQETSMHYGNISSYDLSTLTKLSIDSTNSFKFSLSKIKDKVRETGFSHDRMKQRIGELKGDIDYCWQLKPPMLDKAAQYCIIIAELHVYLNSYSDAIYYYELAIDLDAKSDRSRLDETEIKSIISSLEAEIHPWKR